MMSDVHVARGDVLARVHAETSPRTNTAHVPSSWCSTHPPRPNQTRLGSASATPASIAPLAFAIIGGHPRTHDHGPIDWAASHPHQDRAQAGAPADPAHAS